MKKSSKDAITVITILVAIVLILIQTAYLFAQIDEDIRSGREVWEGKRGAIASLMRERTPPAQALITADIAKYSATLVLTIVITAGVLIVVHKVL